MFMIPGVAIQKCRPLTHGVDVITVVPPGEYPRVLRCIYAEISVGLTVVVDYDGFVRFCYARVDECRVGDVFGHDVAMINKAFTGANQNYQGDARS
mmetsp:Transcript_6435/g.8088  ORF Transcript_6435/g.8088 Transcript_6435/m.8088 type:complete len:96 (-) Transcript_6435:145-432(-)